MKLLLFKLVLVNTFDYGFVLSQYIVQCLESTFHKKETYACSREFYQITLLGNMETYTEFIQTVELGMIKHVM
ncbi:MAG: hypothetical protein ACRD6U_07625 [Nitrososphaeraceae archaeon]